MVLQFHPTDAAMAFASHKSKNQKSSKSIFSVFSVSCCLRLFSVFNWKDQQREKYLLLLQYNLKVAAEEETAEMELLKYCWLSG